MVSRRCMQMKNSKKCLPIFLCIGTIIVFYGMFQCSNSPKSYMIPRESVKYVYDDKNIAIPYDQNSPLIFIGGMPRSGTTLMRVMMDAHPDVRCGEETRVIPRILGMRNHWQKSEIERKRLVEAGINDVVIDSAVSAFILEIIAKHGDAAPRLCNKDPFTLKSSQYLSTLFPNAKFILMIRDGRAVIHSVISRKVTISGFDLKNPKMCLEKWNTAMEVMYSQCLRVGPLKCMPVYYEQLALHPDLWMHRILEFVDLPWNNSVLHHEDFIGKPGGASLSKTEKSTDQVIKPVNIEALSKWVGFYSEDILENMAKIAPMLQTLGYDPNKNPPDYGKPDPKVADNTMHIKQNMEYWRQKEQDILAKEKKAGHRPPPPPPS